MPASQDEEFLWREGEREREREREQTCTEVIQ
jgi:hypothetical protein